MKGIRSIILKIAINNYSQQGCDGSTMTLEDFYNSYHPTENLMLIMAVEAYNIATNSDIDLDDMMSW